VITFTCDGILIDGNIKEVIVLMEKLGASLMSYLRTAPIQERTARAAEKGRADLKATQEAWKQLDGDETECLVRSLMGRHATTMSQLFLSAKRDETKREFCTCFWTVARNGNCAHTVTITTREYSTGTHEPTAVTNASTRQAQAHGSAWTLSWQREL